MATKKDATTEANEANKAPATTVPEQQPEPLPTYAEAQQMFKDRPELFAVVTVEGRLTRDGILTHLLHGA